MGFTNVLLELTPNLSMIGTRFLIDKSIKFLLLFFAHGMFVI